MTPAQQKGIAFIAFHSRVVAVVMEKYEFFPFISIYYQMKSWYFKHYLSLDSKPGQA